MFTLQAEGKRLKERYDFVADNTDKLLKRMLSAMEELAKFRSEVGTFRTWMEKSYKVLEDKERQLANLNKLQGSAEGIKEFVSDVMTHGADLKFLTISGRKYVDLSRVTKHHSHMIFLKFAFSRKKNIFFLAFIFFPSFCQACQKKVTSFQFQCISPNF